MTEIYGCLPRPPSRESAVKCPSQKHHRMARVRLESRPYGSDFIMIVTNSKRRRDGSVR